MSEQVILALIIAVPAALVPTVALWMNNRQARKVKEDDATTRREEKAAENTRADELEARRKKDVDEVARLLKVSTAAQVESFGELKGLGEQTHTLVNSNLTEEKEDKLDQMHDNLVTLIALHKLTVDTPEKAIIAERIKVRQGKIDRLTVELEKRREVTSSAAADRRVTETATKAATAALTAAGPLAVKIEQDDANPVPVKPIDSAPAPPK